MRVFPTLWRLLDASRQDTTVTRTGLTIIKLSSFALIFHNCPIRMGVFIGYNFLIGCFSRMSYKSCTRKLCDHRTWFYHFILNTTKIIKQSLDIMTLLSAYINFTLVSIHLLSIRNQIESVSDCCLMPTQQFFSKFSI